MLRNVIKIITVVFFVGSASAQFYEETRMSGVGNPYFSIQIFRTIADDLKSGRLYIYSNIINDDLTFVKNDSLDQFEAGFEWEVSVVDEEEEQQVASRSIRKEVIETDFTETNNREKDILLDAVFDLPGAEYVITMQMRDLISKKALSRKLEIEMFDFDKQKMNMSDILFVNESSVKEDGTLINYVPRVNSNFSRKSPYIYLYNEIYTNEYPVTVSLHYQFEDTEEEVTLDTTIYKELTAPLNSQIFQLKKQNIPKNNYRCIVTVKRGGDQVSRSRKISFFWINMPETSEDIAMALRQMRYILTTDSLDKYLDASLDEQKVFFERFWAERDPNPSTEANELMEEYFSRVNFANREFSSFNNDGWLSDRGRILIKFGYPDDVERHPFEMDSVPYVIWRYYSQRRVFVFADQSGFGDYRLLPSYRNQEY